MDAAFDDDQSTDPFLLDSPVLAALQGASVVGRVATGPRAGQHVLRLGSAANAPVVSSGGPRHAHLKGFDLHANVAVRAGDRARLEHLARYVLRPPVAQDALELTPDGKVLLHLRRPWRDGTRAIRFEATELVEKLAALVPRPRANMLIYHGAFAPRGYYHESAVIEQTYRATAAIAPLPSNPAESAAAQGTATSSATEAPTECSSIAAAATVAAPRVPPVPAAYTRPRHFAWADLLRRIFLFDILACADCGGRLRLVATIQERAVVEKILRHLGLPVDVPAPAPARAPPWLPGLGTGNE